jgi:MFS family permease
VFVSILRVSTLLIGVAFLLTGHGLQLALIPLRAELMGWDSMAMGLLGSIYFAGFLAGCVVVPRLVGRIGHIRSFATLTALMTSSILMLALFNAFGFWLILRFIAGLSISGLYLVVESWLNEITENEVRGGVLATYTAVVLTALAGGQLLLNVASMENGNLFIIAATLIVLAAIPICVTRTSQPAQIPAATFSPLLVLRTSRVAALGATVAGIVASVYYALGPAYGLQMGMDIPAISSMMALGTAGGAISLLPLGRLSDKRDRRVIIAGVMLVGAFVSVVAWLAPVSSVPILMFLFGACVMPIQALCLAHASDNIENQSFLEVGTGLLIMNAFGSILGPLIAAQSMQWYGSATFFLFNAVILSVSGILILLMISSRTPARKYYSKFVPVTTAAAQGALQMYPCAEDAESSE